MVTMVTSYCNYLVDLGVTAEKLKSIGHHTHNAASKDGWQQHLLVAMGF